MARICFSGKACKAALAALLTEFSLPIESSTALYSFPAFQMTIMRFIKMHKWAVSITLIALFLFYWYEVRPITTYRGCVTQASVDSRKLLDSKLSLAKEQNQIEFYTNLKEKNMYLRSDYESFLNKCLLYYGLQPERTSTGAIVGAE